MADACPECGARRLVRNADLSWLLTARSGVVVLCWTTPLAFAAWITPHIANAGDTHLEWFLLIAAVVAVVAVGRLGRCAADEGAAIWARRLGPIMVVSMAAWCASLFVTFIYIVPDSIWDSWSYCLEALSCLNLVICTTWCVFASRVVASIAEQLGLPRPAARLRRGALISAWLVPPVFAWTQVGWPIVQAIAVPIPSPSGGTSYTPAAEFLLGLAYNGSPIIQWLVALTACLTIYLLLEMHMAVKLCLAAGASGQAR